MPVDSKKPTPLFASNSTRKSPNLRLEAMVNTNSSFRRFVKEAIHSTDEWRSELREWNHTHPTQTVGESEFESYLAHEKQQLGLHTVFTSKPSVPTPQKPVSLSQISTPKEYRAWIEAHYTPQERRMLGFADSDILQKKNRFAHLFSQITHFIPEEDVERLLKQSESARSDGDMYQQYLYWRDHLNPKFQRLFPDDLFVGFRSWNRMKHQLPEAPLEKEVENKIIQAVEQKHEEKAKEEEKEKKEDPRESTLPTKKEEDTRPTQVLIEEAAPVGETPDLLRPAETVYTPVPLASNPTIAEEESQSPMTSQAEVSSSPSQPFQSRTPSSPPSQREQQEEKRDQSHSNKIQQGRQRYNQYKKLNSAYNKYKGGERNISKLFGKGESQAGKSGSKFLQKAIRPVGRVLGKGLGRLGLMGGGSGGTVAAGGAGAAGVGAGAAAGTGAVAGGTAVTTGVVASSPVWVPIVLLILGILLVLFFFVIWIFLIFFMEDDKLATIILQKSVDKTQLPNPKDAATLEETYATFTISASHDESAGIQIYDDLPDNADFVSATGTYIAYDAAGNVVADPKTNAEAVRRVVWQFNGDGTTPTGGGNPGTDKPNAWPATGTLTQGPRGEYVSNGVRGGHINIFETTGGYEPVDIAGAHRTPIYATFNGVVKATHFLVTEPGPNGTGYWNAGNSIELSDTAGSFSILHAHLDQINVAQGQEVKKGDVIGLMGTTGVSSGTHLHWEFRGLPLAPPYIPQAITPANCNPPAIECSPSNVSFN